jgi:hypothetical protein
VRCGHPPLALHVLRGVPSECVRLESRRGFSLTARAGPRQASSGGGKTEEKKCRSNSLAGFLQRDEKPSPPATHCPENDIFTSTSEIPKTQKSGKGPSRGRSPFGPPFLGRGVLVGAKKREPNATRR